MKKLVFLIAFLLFFNLAFACTTDEDCDAAFCQISYDVGEGKGMGDYYYCNLAAGWCSGGNMARCPDNTYCDFTSCPADKTGGVHGDFEVFQSGCCKSCLGFETSCSDSNDEDCDGCVDSADSDCGATETECSDGIDNDCDGFTDKADSDCPCSSDDDCTDPEKPFCNPENGNCAACLTDSDCTAISCTNSYDINTGYGDITAYWCDGIECQAFPMWCENEYCDFTKCPADGSGSYYGMTGEGANCCASCESSETACSDSNDNDCDGFVDSDDTDCQVTCDTNRDSCCEDANCDSYCSDLTWKHSGTCSSVGSACSYTDSNCDDGNECTDNSCDDSSGCSNPNIADGTACTGGTCQSGTCVAADTGCSSDSDCSGSTPYCSSSTCVACTSDSHCDDTNECTADTCSSNSCSNTNVADSTSCSVGICQSGTCVETCSSDSDCSGSTPYCVLEECVECTSDSHCDDSDSCTTDACSSNACSHTSITECTGDDNCCPTGCTLEIDSDCLTCASGKIACEAECVTPACSADSECDDGDVNTDDTCENPGTCTAECANEMKKCENGQVLCTGVCTTPACTADEDCDDGVAETLDTCNDAGTCDAVCTSEECTIACTTDAQCDDGDDTTEDSCASPGTCRAKCSHTLLHKCLTNLDCDDDNPCTRDLCSGVVKDCYHEEIGTCASNGRCFKLGALQEAENKTVYCSDSGEFVEQKEAGEACWADYECVTEWCVDYECKKAAAPNLIVAILEAIVAFFLRLFGRI